MIRIFVSSKRIGKLAIVGLVAGIGTSAMTSQAVAENYIGGQTYGIRKCARAVLHGYEVRGVKIFGHKFNCKPMNTNAKGRKFINLSHDQVGMDDQSYFSFNVNSRNEYRGGTLKKKTHKGWTIMLPPPPGTEYEGRGNPPVLTTDDYRGFVNFAKDLKSFRPNNLPWEDVPYCVAAVVIAELGNPENRGTAPRDVPCDLPTVYTHDNYAGSKLRLDNGPDPDLHDNGGKFADSISSICVPRGWVVRAFEHKTYKGKKLEIVGPKRYEDLKRQIGWGDRISSIAAFRQR